MWMYYLIAFSYASPFPLISMLIPDTNSLIPSEYKPIATALSSSTCFKQKNKLYSKISYISTDWSMKIICSLLFKENNKTNIIIDLLNLPFTFCSSSSRAREISSNALKWHCFCLLKISLEVLLPLELHIFK